MSYSAFGIEHGDSFSKGLPSALKGKYADELPGYAKTGKRAREAFGMTKKTKKKEALKIASGNPTGQMKRKDYAALKVTRNERGRAVGRELARGKSKRLDETKTFGRAYRNLENTIQ